MALRARTLHVLLTSGGWRPPMRSFHLRKKMVKKVDNPPVSNRYPYLYENGTLYDGMCLDDAKNFRPVVVHHPILEKRYEQFQKDKEAGKFPQLDAPGIPFGEWNPEQSVRVGLIAMKIKGYRFWDVHGNAIPVTMLWAPNSSVVAHKFPSRDGRWACIVSAGYPNDDDPLDNSEAALYAKVAKSVPGYHMRHVMKEFAVTEDAMLPIGFRVSVRHFLPGQPIDIQSTTKPKGFQGVMKRWGFKGGPASHGASLFHRRPGSIGGTGLGVLPGKKMPGHKGNERCSCPSYVFMIDFKNDLLYVQGTIPGATGQYVVIRDSYWKDFDGGEQPPFPSFAPDPAEDLAALSFEECQLRSQAKFKYHLDFGHPTGGPPIPQA